MSYRMKVFSGWYLEEAANLANDFFRDNAINLHTCQVVTDEEGMVSALVVYSMPEYEIVTDNSQTTLAVMQDAHTGDYPRDPIAEMATVDAMRGM